MMIMPEMGVLNKHVGVEKMFWRKNVPLSVWHLQVSYDICITLAINMNRVYIGKDLIFYPFLWFGTRPTSPLPSCNHFAYEEMKYYGDRRNYFLNSDIFYLEFGQVWHSIGMLCIENESERNYGKYYREKIII